MLFLLQDAQKAKAKNVSSMKNRLDKFLRNQKI